MIGEVVQHAEWPLTEGWNHAAGLARLRRRGLRPRCIYDIGSSTGAWTSTAAHVFPLAEFHLFEPLLDIEPLYRERVDVLTSRPGLRIRAHPVGLDSTSGPRRIGIAEHPMGSSMLATEPSKYFPRVAEVQADTLDAYVADHHLSPPDLIKIDTQGAELRILEGAQNTLNRTTGLVVETWLERGYGPETPLLHEVIEWLARRNFFTADVFGEYRDGDRLVTLDLLFVRSTSRSVFTA